MPFISFGWLAKIVLLEEQNNESLEMAEDDAKPIETETDAEKTTPTDSLDEKPDINDAPMEENQVLHDIHPISPEIII